MQYAFLNAAKIVCVYSGLQVFPFTKLVALGAKQVKPIEGDCCKHIAFRPPNIVRKWAWKREWKFQSNHISFFVAWLGTR